MTTLGEALSENIRPQKRNNGVHSLYGPGDRIGLHRVVQLRARTNTNGVVIVEYLIESELLNERHWVSEFALKMKLQNAQVTG